MKKEEIFVFFRIFPRWVLGNFVKTDYTSTMELGRNQGSTIDSALPLINIIVSHVFPVSSMGWDAVF